MNQKPNLKILLFVIGLLLSIGIIICGFFLFYKNNNKDNQFTQNSQTDKTIKPSEVYKKYISQEFFGISFDYPDNWILIPATDKDGKIIIKNFTEGTIEQYGENGFQIEISLTDMFKEKGLWQTIASKEYPKTDNTGNPVLSSQSLYVGGVLSLKQEMEITISTYTVFYTSEKDIKIKCMNKNSIYIHEYQKLLDSYQTNIVEDYH